MRRTIMVVASLLVAMGVYAANFAFWANRSVVDQDAFVSSAVASFARDGSYDALGIVITDKVIEAYPSLEVLQQTLVPLFTGLIATPAFEPALVDVSTQIHDDVIGGAGAAVTIDIADYEAPLLAAISLISPTLAEEVPRELFTTFVVFDAGDVPDVSRPAGSVSTFAWFALMLAAAGAIVVWLDLRSVGRWMAACGLALVVAGLATAFLVVAARFASNEVVTSDAYRTLGSNLYDELVGSLVVSTLVIGIVGLVLAVTGGLLVRGGRGTGARS